LDERILGPRRRVGLEAVRLAELHREVERPLGSAHVVAFADQERERIEAEARDYLRRLAVTLPGVAVEDVVRLGDPTTEVIAEAEQTGADLIAVAVPRCRGLARFFGRRATRRLRRSTTIPLLIIPCAAPAAA
jgi:nucleotide-binding universal stress UspA family protein